MPNINDKKIIHVMVDEKFNDMAIIQFEKAARGVHEYWVVTTDLIFTKSTLALKCTLDSLFPQLSRPDIAGVVFHSLPVDHYTLLRRIPENKCVVWLGYGYDYYSILNFENDAALLFGKTRSLQEPTFKRLLKRVLSPVLHKIRTKRDKHFTSDLNRINYFSPVLDSEYEMVRRHVPLRAEYITWNYGTAEDDLSYPGMGFSAGCNILAGNSATATNNHIELFEAIKDQVDLSGRKVITPLSYGDPHYRTKVIREGERLFGEAFTPLTTFMPKEVYLETIRSCGFIMMNHIRQQALGNICMGMLMGAKVYLNRENPLTGWLSARGAIMGSIETLNLEHLNENDKETNRRLVYSHWGREQQNQKTKQLIRTILSHGMRHI